MAISPLRAFCAGIVLVLVLAATFVAGIFIGGGPAISAVDAQPAVAVPAPGCPTPDLRSSRTEHDMARSCVLADIASATLEASGVSDPRVEVAPVESEALLGPERTWRISATVDDVPRAWDADAAATALAARLGVSSSDIVILDGRMRILNEGFVRGRALPTTPR